MRYVIDSLRSMLSLVVTLCVRAREARGYISHPEGPYAMIPSSCLRPESVSKEVRVQKPEGSGKRDHVAHRPAAGSPAPCLLHDCPRGEEDAHHRPPFRSRTLQPGTFRSKNITRRLLALLSLSTPDNFSASPSDTGTFV
jgi:hypothetical protein